MWAAMNNMACTSPRDVYDTSSLGWLPYFSGYGTLSARTNVVAC